MMDKCSAEAHMAKAARGRNEFSPSHIHPYQYWAQLAKVVDGDTLDLVVSLGFNTSVSNRFRLLGINCAEIHGVKHSSAEFAAGTKARAFVEGLVQPGDWLEIVAVFDRREKYGRWLCEVFVGGESLNVRLLTEGLAEPLDGG